MRTADDRHPDQIARLRAAVIVVVVFAVIAPSLSYADTGWSGTVPVKARTLADRGRAYHDAGDYANAIAAFTQAYAMAPSPALLFNLAQAYRLLGNCDDAALMYRRFIATNPSPDERALAETHLASVERCVHKLALHIPVEVAARRPAATAAKDPLAATVAVHRPSRSAQITKDAGLGLALGGSVALAVAGYYALQANAAANDVARAYDMGAKWKDVAPIDERGKTAATRAKLFGAGGAVGVAGGIVMYLIGKRAEQPPITVAPRGRGVEVSMLWTF